MRRLIFNLHLYLALAAAVFVAILGLTGAIMAFEPELDHVFHLGLTYVTPQGSPMPLSGIAAAVDQAFPGERIAAYAIATDPRIAYGALLPRRGQVMVNPYTGQILGVRAGGPDFLSRVHQLHLRLLIQNRADPGKMIVSWVGLILVFLSISGLYLWWPYQRVRISRGASGFRWWFDLHNSIGILSFAFLLILSITGVMIGFEETTVPLFYKMTGTHPSPRPSPRPQDFPAPPPGAKPISPDEALEIARQAIPGATPFQIQVPGPRGAYQIRSRFPEDLTPGGRSAVMVDQYSGKVLFAEGSRTAPAGSRIVIQNRAIHTGDIFGIPSKALASLMCLLIVMQAVSGTLMWWKRPRKTIR